MSSYSNLIRRFLVVTLHNYLHAHYPGGKPLHWKPSTYAKGVRNELCQILGPTEPMADDFERVAERAGFSPRYVSLFTFKRAELRNTTSDEIDRQIVCAGLEFFRILRDEK